MIKRITLIVLTILCQVVVTLAQQKYTQVWAALNTNDHAKASTLSTEAMHDKATFADNYITNIYLKSYNGKEGEITDFDKEFYPTVENPYPYIYALWFYKPVLGEYGKKTDSQLRMLDKILTDSKAHGTLVAAAHYQKGFNSLFSNNFDAADKEYSKIGNIRNWQYVGIFENLSKSGFYKNYGPLEHPEGSAEFISISNAKVKWFTPTYEITDGWTPFCFQFNKRTGIAYAQTFVNSESDQEVICNTGATGSLKIWINDVLIFSEYTERVTEMDTYSVKCKLHKGINRILVQVGFTKSPYPNFNMRLTDTNFKAIPNLAGSSVYKPYGKETNSQVVVMKHFAEDFFQKKISDEPDNFVNYLLLADVYLRNKKTLEARRLMESALQKAPHNNLLRMKLIQVLIKEDNKSRMLEEVEKIKKDDPECLLALDLGIQNDTENEQYEDASKKLAQRESLFGEDITTISYKLSLLIKEKKYDELVTTVERAFKKYPTSPLLLPIMYSIRKEVYKDPSGALKIYEGYLRENYNYEISKNYTRALREQGDTKKSLQVQLNNLDHFKYDPHFRSEMASYYYNAKQYDQAEKYIKESLSLSPYHEYYWEQLGDIKSELKQTDEAITAYNNSLMYDPNQYEVINKIRKLKGKSETYKLVPQIDVDAIIKKDNPAQALNTDYGHYVIHDESSVVMYPGGATEEYYTYILRITNEKGIERYKESTISYGRRQELLIESSDVIKKSGARVKGERNDNEIVFTNLEVGDIIVLKYRLQNYEYGRFVKDYWNKHYFKENAYTAFMRYSLLIPASQTLNYTTTNTDIKPTISNVEDFKQYTWQVEKQEGLKEEPIMPAYVDVAPVLHLSTVPNWQEIADWYADMINNASEESYEVTSLFNTLLPEADRSKITQYEKAQRIYNFIQKNIRYSHVSFRQSAYLPQQASVTLNTRLGDCKDLSNLFMTLCRMAGISCKMVLVDTYDNGAQDMILPSIDFNHCIAKVSLDNKEYYIELTDNYLPFASLPNNLINAQILEIPQKSEHATLKSLTTTTRTKDIVKRTMYIKPVGSDLQIHVKTSKYGNLSSRTRSDYSNLDYEKQLKGMQEAIAGSYKNNVEMDTITFGDLESLQDSVNYEYAYRVKDEVAEVGNLQTFKIAYPDIIASLTKFASTKRTYPVNYNEYEDTDQYETSVIIEVEKGKKFIGLPVNENQHFKNMTYSLQYKLLSPEKLKITRTFTSDRNIIPVEDYLTFKAFIEKIVKAEQKMIAFQ